MLKEIPFYLNGFERIRIVKELSENNINVEEQFKEYYKLTKRSRRTFWRDRQKLKISKNFIPRKIEKCLICNKSGKILEHHLCYKPEIKISICSSCHSTIHLIDKKGFKKIKRMLEYYFKEMSQYLIDSTYDT